MSTKERPYIAHCSFCGDGMLRFVKCDTCDEVVALCDECELMWADVAAVSDDANLSSDSSFPRCPHCGDSAADFYWMEGEDIRGSRLENFADGDSI